MHYWCILKMGGWTYFQLTPQNCKPNFTTQHPLSNFWICIYPVLMSPTITHLMPKTNNTAVTLLTESMPGAVIVVCIDPGRQ